MPRSPRPRQVVTLVGVGSSGHGYPSPAGRRQRRATSRARRPARRARLGCPAALLGGPQPRWRGRGGTHPGPDVRRPARKGLAARSNRFRPVRARQAPGTRAYRGAARRSDNADGTGGGMAARQGCREASRGRPEYLERLRDGRPRAAAGPAQPGDRARRMGRHHGGRVAAGQAGPGSPHRPALAGENGIAAPGSHLPGRRPRGRAAINALQERCRAGCAIGPRNCRWSLLTWPLAAAASG